jgi:nucleoid-associated protein YgaU
MTQAGTHHGYIRMALMGTAFIGLTVVLLVFQPGSKRQAQVTIVSDTSDNSITRDAGLLDDLTAVTAQSDRAAPKAPQVTPASRDTPGTDGQRTAVTAENPPTNLRDMTFSAISQVKSATTGQAPAPGQPGSLLHSVVQRSMATNAPAEAQPSPTRADALRATTGADDSPEVQTYQVRAGDTLGSIARALYGDVNMSTHLFTTNTDIMARPDSLTPGMVLTLPVPVPTTSGN